MSRLTQACFFTRLGEVDDFVGARALGGLLVLILLDLIIFILIYILGVPLLLGAGLVVSVARLSLRS